MPNECNLHKVLSYMLERSDSEPKCHCGLSRVSLHRNSAQPSLRQASSPYLCVQVDLVLKGVLASSSLKPLRLLLKVADALRQGKFLHHNQHTPSAIAAGEQSMLIAIHALTHLFMQCPVLSCAMMRCTQ